MIEQFRKPVAALAQKLISHGAGVQFQVEDLANVAYAAIWRARHRYNPSLATWKTYGMIKARSAMLDELRALDHIPRLERARAKQEGRELPKVETASHDPAVFDGKDQRVRGPVDAVGSNDFWRRLSRIVGPRGADVLERYYRRDYTLREIGHQLGLSESRVCQLHSKAVRLLKWKGREVIA